MNRLVLAMLVFCGSMQAAVTLPSLITDHMMLQRDAPARIWGKANPGEAVTVRFAGQEVPATASAEGRWEAWLKPMAAGTEGTLRVEGDNSIAVEDVLVGEVWVASGQSNMAWPVERSNDPEKEAAGANYPGIRLFQVTMTTSDEPLEDVEGSWKLCSPETVPPFSAVGYFFARQLHREIGVPVGMIQSAWGGTPAEAWTSVEALKAEPELWSYLNNWDNVLAVYPSQRLRYEEALRLWREAGEQGQRPGGAPRGPGHQHAPATLYNAMIAPLTPYSIRGAIWYQGESNAGNGYLYRSLFKTMILDWRAKWAQGDFPFLLVQLANYENPGSWPELREAQTMALQLDRTGMAVTIDIGNPTDIHPRNKQDVGDRLALWAQAMVYGQDVAHSGPLYRQGTKEGSKMRIWFDHTDSGLRAEGGSLEGFAIAGPDRVFVPADAVIDGDTVLVSSELVSQPAAVRYAWANDPPNSLRNSAELPASPFRTDDWTNARMDTGDGR